MFRFVTTLTTSSKICLRFEYNIFFYCNQNVYLLKLSSECSPAWDTGRRGKQNIRTDKRGGFNAFKDFLVETQGSLIPSHSRVVNVLFPLKSRAPLPTEFEIIDFTHNSECGLTAALSSLFWEAAAIQSAGLMAMPAALVSSNGSSRFSAVELIVALNGKSYTPRWVPLGQHTYRMAVFVVFLWSQLSLAFHFPPVLTKGVFTGEVVHTHMAVYHRHTV